jgi:hypothetical protein
VLFSALGVTLVATVVSGREKPAADLVVEPARSDVRVAAKAEAELPPDLDIESLRRARKGAPIADLFSASQPDQPPGTPGNSAQAEGPGAAPVEQPLPFQYLGRMVDDGRLSVFLTRGDDTFTVHQGETLEQYRVDKVADASISFTHVPTGARKVLSIPPLN